MAVLDSGLDINHEDIKPVLWKNTKEIENNQTDDDGNGYIDDYNGWNFIGGEDGYNLEAETLELTKLFRKHKTQFEGKNKFNISEEEKEDYMKYLYFMKIYNEGKGNIEKGIERNKEEFEFFNEFIPPLQQAIGKKIFTNKELKKAKSKKTNIIDHKAKFFKILERNSSKNFTAEGLTTHFEELQSRMESMQSRLKYNYSLDFDGRKIIGDNYYDLNEKNYGNNDVSKRADHGTHVSGIIGADRNNSIGIKGIADNVLIMPVRGVPMGDEADKDIANGIYYAVNNGAKIINMSFGKDFSPEKEIVDKAVKYAQSKGVLLVHGAGNDSKNIDYFYNYPSPLLLDGTIISNWIEVGASSISLNEELAAEFSNYGKTAVDIFAPGVDIYSTIPENKYKENSGTSMAAPVVSGVAALLFSYFPDLTPEQVKEILLESGTSYDIEVFKPGTQTKVPFESLSKSGKIVNAYYAVKLALEKNQK